MNLLTTLSCAYYYLIENNVVPFFQLTPWSILGVEDPVLTIRGKADEDSEITTKVSEIKELASGRHDLRVLLHYLELVSSISATLDHYSIGMEKLRLQSKNAGYDYDQHWREFPKPIFVYKLFESGYVSVGGCSTTRWIVDWILMSKGLLSADGFAYTHPNSDDCCGIPKKEFRAWGPFFTVHKVKAEFFKKYFWQITLSGERGEEYYDFKSTREWIDGSEFVSKGEYFELSSFGEFRCDDSIAGVIKRFQKYGYSVDDAWEFFRHEDGFFSHLFKPSALSHSSEYEDETLIADQIFLKQFVPRVFNTVFGKPSRKKKRIKSAK